MNTALSLLDPTKKITLKNLYRDEADVNRWVPDMDLIETAAEYIVEAELPGLNKSDLSITFENNVLMISGKKEKPSDNKENTFLRTERHFGSFTRSISLGNDIVSDNIEAEYKNGLLTVRIPKIEKAQPKMIDIK